MCGGRLRAKWRRALCLSMCSMHSSVHAGCKSSRDGETLLRRVSEAKPPRSRDERPKSLKPLSQHSRTPGRFKSQGEV